MCAKCYLHLVTIFSLVFIVVTTSPFFLFLQFLILLVGISTFCRIYLKRLFYINDLMKDFKTLVTQMLFLPKGLLYFVDPKALNKISMKFKNVIIIT